MFLTHPAPVPVIVKYATADGTAHSGTDYIGTAGTITLAAGEVERTVYVTVPTNLMAQGQRQFALNLAEASGVPIGAASASATILDDDSGANVLYFDSQPSDGAGRGIRQLLTVLDGTFEGTLDGGHASIGFRGRLGGPRLELADPQGDPLLPGAYENAERWPFKRRGRLACRSTPVSTAATR